MEKIYKRDIADEVLCYIKTTDEAIVLHGARQVGKTYLMYYLMDHLKAEGSRVYYIDLEDSRYRRVLDTGIDEFINLLREVGTLKDLNSKVFVFIDEIQYLQEPSEFLKIIVDHHKYIKLIVSGSSTFNIKTKFKTALVGRTLNFEVFPLSFSEFLRFKEYHHDPDIPMTSKKEAELLSLYREYVLYGGYPKIVKTDELELKEKRLQQIIDTYLFKDVRELGRIENLDKFNKLLEVLASQSANLLNLQELSNTCKLSLPSLEKYLLLLENTYIIKLVRPYHKNLRSELYKQPKVFFYDSGLMQMLWLKRFPQNIIGTVFETNVFSELVKKFGPNKIHFWRTKDKKEIDFILTQDPNLPLPIEVKLRVSAVRLQPIKHFNTKYNLPKDYYKIIVLEKDIERENTFYPFEAFLP